VTHLASLRFGSNLSSDPIGRAGRSGPAANVKRALPRDQWRSAKGQRPAPFSIPLGELDEVAKRFALWSVRKQWDWDVVIPRASGIDSELGEQITDDIWELDVTLRKSVEGAARAGDSNRARTLRPVIEGAAGELAASIDVARSALTDQDVSYEVGQIVEYCDVVGNDLDAFLTRAGAPGTS